MSVPLRQVDAFTGIPFAGNPAAVCLLDREREAGWMQSVATEMNLSETAFVRPVQAGFDLRWFTPAAEVDLCGHATLATAHVLFEEGILVGDAEARFLTRSGELIARKPGDEIDLDFPATPPEPCNADPRLAAALGVEPVESWRTRFDFLLRVADAATVREMQPDMMALAGITSRGVIVTAPADGGEADFVSRFFAPAIGVPEDPVTGSAHCALAPYWAGRLHKREMTGVQLSRRGGVVRTRLEGDRVVLSGKAVTVLRGALIV